MTSLSPKQRNEICSKKRKVSRQPDSERLAQVTMAKYETEFKKRIAVSNAQVKTKKCGGFVEIIQPVKTQNNIPFLYNERKVKTLKNYLETSEPQIHIPYSYIINTLG